MLYNMICAEVTSPHNNPGSAGAVVGFPEQKHCSEIAGFDLFWEGENIRKRAHGFFQTSPVLFSVMIRLYFHTTLLYKC